MRWCGRFRGQATDQGTARHQANQQRHRRKYERPAPRRRGHRVIRQRSPGQGKSGHIGIGATVAEHDARLANVLQTLGAVALQATGEQKPQAVRRVIGQAVPGRIGLENSRQCIADRIALEDTLARQHLQQDNTEGPDVGPPVDRRAARLLGAHVGRRAQDYARSGHGRSYRGRVQRLLFGRALALERARQAKIQHLHLTFIRQFHVGRFQVAVNDAGGVGRFESLGDLAGNRDRFFGRHRSPFDAFGQVFARGAFHDQEMQPVIGLQAVDRGDGGMVQRRQRAGFAMKAGQALVVLGEVVGQDFQRHLTSEFGVARQIDGSHAAFAEFAEDFVVRESATDHGGAFGSMRMGLGSNSVIPAYFTSKCVSAPSRDWACPQSGQAVTA